VKRIKKKKGTNGERRGEREEGREKGRKGNRICPV